MSNKINNLIQKYGHSVPRYTSFPTAVQFKNSVSQDLYLNCLKNLDQEETVSLYIHIPFCHSLCHYCGCNTKIVNSYSPIQLYIHSLLREIKIVGKILEKRIPISRIHFGGGTPNYALTSDIKKIIEELSIQFKFTPETQIDMECDPRLLNKEKIESYSKLGITRISLGIQDFDENVQKSINRVQPYKQVKQLMKLIRTSNISQINFDLIIGLPNQNSNTVIKTLNKVLKLKPSRIAVFPYAHVPWMKKHQILLEKYSMPDANERFKLNVLVNDTLIKSDYAPIGIDHYALKTDPLYKAQLNQEMKRNFQGYTDDASVTILGLGLSSISQFRNAYVQNSTDISHYKNSINKNSTAISRNLVLTDEDQVRKKLIENLMCYFNINFDDFSGINIPKDRLLSFAQDDLIIMTTKHLYITERGKPFTRNIAACFDPYFSPEGGCYSKAV